MAIDSEHPANVWEAVLERLRDVVDGEEFRRWLGPTTYASDAGDQITVWVPTETDRRYVVNHFLTAIEHALGDMGRVGTHVRFVAGGVGDDDDEKDY
jgi:chromosomal replication initiation ATPase DnaA